MTTTYGVCHPKRGKTSDTCFTDQVLYKLRDDYNRQYPSNQIKTDDPKTIWNALNERWKSECANETCWLTKIHTSIKHEDVFAPKQPSEWIGNPTTWLSNFDIMKVLKQYESVYPEFKMLGPSPIDFDKVLDNQCVEPTLCKFSLAHLMKTGKTKFGVVFNLDPHDKGGSHWVSMFIDIPNRFIMYYNSTGEPIPKQIAAFKDRVIKEAKSLNIPLKYYENSISHQRSNTECGMYSLYFIVTMLTERADKYVNEVLSMAQKLELFTKQRIPDEKVKSYRSKFFSPVAAGGGRTRKRRRRTRRRFRGGRVKDLHGKKLEGLTKEDLQDFTKTFIEWWVPNNTDPTGVIKTKFDNYDDFTNAVNQAFKQSQNQLLDKFNNEMEDYEKQIIYNAMQHVLKMFDEDTSRHKAIRWLSTLWNFLDYNNWPGTEETNVILRKINSVRNPKRVRSELQIKNKTSIKNLFENIEDELFTLRRPEEKKKEKEVTRKEIYVGQNDAFINNVAPTTTAPTTPP